MVERTQREMTAEVDASSPWARKGGAFAVVLGLVAVAAGIGVLYLGGLCGFQADAARAAGCADRWNLAGGVLTAVGLGLFVMGVRLWSRSED